MMIRVENTREREEEAPIRARIASYPENGEPEITEVEAASPGSATAKLTRMVMASVREMGGKVPEESVRELVENLIHADYHGVVVSILEGGNVVRVSDKGPGVPDKERAVEFGFSGATSEALREIRGVGAGLGIARKAAEKVGGTVTLEDNIGGGTVATVAVRAASVSHDDRRSEDRAQRQAKAIQPAGVPRMNISERQQKVLITVLECGEVGPSTVAERLDMSVSTAYRDLSLLEEYGLVVTAESGKRIISPLGRDLIEAIIRDWIK